MKNWLIGVITASLFFLILGYISYNNIIDTTYTMVQKNLTKETGNVKENEKIWSDLKGDGKTHPLKEKFKKKEDAIKSFPFLYSYLKDYPNLDWEDIEIDWVVIQNAINSAGINSQILIPKPIIGYRINRPIIIKQGQTIDFSSNSKIYDYTGDYCFKIIGGAKFPQNSITHVTLKNLDIEGSIASKGAIQLKNAYLVNIENVKVSKYDSYKANAIHLQDFFQINLNTVQVNNVKNGTGIYVDSVTGNSGQLNMTNTIVQRSKVGMYISGSNNLIDGINFYGGAVGNNYSKGVVVRKNVYNLNFIGSHFENHDGHNYSGTTAVEMELSNNTSSESINFLGCIFINNKYGIRSNNVKRVSLTGNQFDARGIKDSVAVKQGKGDGAWIINPNYFVNNGHDLLESGKNHVNLSAVSIDSKGVFYPQNSKAGIYSGSESPEGKIVASPGSIYLRTEESTNYYVYVKQTDKGSKGWKPLKVNN
ncbi:hypothetical protein [Priestia aryabhattai]|uniref:hypothetical protein n=1 Tax=Priestia aryabhattai TaxID=412384 RepID=UPI001C8F05E7|nr:hypothetical protein [Priestia aryabhattai]MBY0063448.1 hypothetical protein [Priestia aryabhattai]